MASMRGTGGPVREVRKGTIVALSVAFVLALVLSLALLAAVIVSLTQGGIAEGRFPEQFRDPGLPLFGGCVLAGLLLGVLIGVPFALLQLPMRRGRVLGPEREHHREPGDQKRA